MTESTKKLVLIGLVIVLACGLLLLVLEPPKSREVWNVRFFDAGKADAAVLYSNRGCVVIDTGERGEGTEILNFLKEKKIHAVDVLIITHFDKDHVGGAAELIKGVEVRQVLQCACPKDGSEYKAYQKALYNQNLTPMTVENTAKFTIGSAEFRVRGTDGKVYAKSESNNASLITSVIFGDNTLFFTGDVEHARLQDILNGGLEHFDLIKMPYHGNWDRLLPQLMEQTTPQYAIITSSEELPESELTLELLTSKDVGTYLTRFGAVSAVCDGKTIKVSQTDKEK